MNQNFQRSVGLVGLFFVWLLFMIPGGIAQHQNQHHGSLAWPDSLASVTFEGTIIIDTTLANPYLLDVNNDEIADYKLAFGPDWYQPESGAERPAAGDMVTITGALHVNSSLPLIVVFEINGLVWRAPVENWWQHQDWPDSLEIVTVTGTVMIDTTYFFVHYYLDTTGDEQPDYVLNFGPPWYQPKDAEKPEPGTEVTIEGALKDGCLLPVLIVFSVDGVVWREPTGPAPWTGRWINGRSNDTTRVHCPNDSMSWMDVPPGAMRGNGHGGSNFPDSVYCEFLHVFGDSLPGRPDSVQYGFHLYLSNPHGHHMQGEGMPVRFHKQVTLTFHYGNGDTTEAPLAKAFSQNEVALKYWDKTSRQWNEVELSALNLEKEVIYLDTEDVYSYYAFFGTNNITGVDDQNVTKIDNFSLQQNYPNPFNPTTVINYQLKNDNLNVRLKIYNLQGQLIRTLVNQTQPAGNYEIVWNGKDDSGFQVVSGIYLYRLSAGEQAQTQRMIFMK